MKIEKFFKENNIQLNQKKLVVATSAGPDSMALLGMLVKLSKKYDFELIAAHFDHQLRIDSSQEAVLIEKFCQENQVPFVNEKWHHPVKEAGVEASARKARYDFLTKTVKENFADYLLTAHHGDDLIENILLKFIRSGNPSEMNSLQEVGQMNGVILLRPLLNFQKQELLAYDKQEGIDYLIDSTNNEDFAMRNRLRHHVLPLLKKENPNLVENAVRFSHQMSKLTKMLAEKFGEIEVEPFLGNFYRVKDEYLRSLSEDERTKFWQELIWQKYHRRVNANLGNYRVEEYQGYFYLMPNKLRINTQIQEIQLENKFSFRNELFWLTRTKQNAYTLVGDFWAEEGNFSAGSLTKGAKLLLQNGHHVKSKKKFAQAAIPDSLRPFCLTIYQNGEAIFVEKTFQSQKKSAEFSHYFLYRLKKA